jgi:hypothetical protein
MVVVPVVGDLRNNPALLKYEEEPLTIAWSFCTLKTAPAIP